MATQQGKNVPVQNSKNGSNGGKTNEQMLSLGRNQAKVAQQKGK